jgi:hypothetical protein
MPFGRALRTAAAIIEAGTVLGLAISAAIAVATPAPFLQDLSPGVDKRIFPRSDAAQEATVGSIRIRRTARPGCVELDGDVRAVFCNQHLHCSANIAQAWSFEVFQLDPRDIFYLETGSQCNSACCDWRGMTFTAEGRRLDDGVVQRVMLRLGIAGSAACVMGLAGLVWMLRKRQGRSVVSRIGVIAGFGLAIARLWWNL